MMLLRKTLLVTALTLAATGAGAGAAGATPGPTPDQGLTGACNMTNTNAGYGMFTVSQSVSNPNGWDAGMGTAINNSTGGNPINCEVPSTPPPQP